MTANTAYATLDPATPLPKLIPFPPALPRDTPLGRVRPILALCAMPCPGPRSGARTT